jgi:D-tagatose-1,6-bisphosphate aldolase subunit GatZ/KbaZ
MKIAKNIFLDLMAANRNGEAKGIYSICSANQDVLEACMKQANADGSIVLIESTSNQVDQFGGYTGMKPADFVRYVHAIAEKVAFPKEMILLGGDHLGPNPWKNLPAEKAMDHAKTLIRDYVNAGYQKIHLDTSMFCADDSGDRTKPLDDEIVAARSASLCRIAEDSWEKYRQGTPKPVYIIGTEVPVPGGAQEEENEVVPTTSADVEKTISIAHKHFTQAGLSTAWERVVGVVVQPGVEFGDDRVFNYQREKAKELSNKIMQFDNLVYEAHSTDYQAESKLKQLVEDHFAILKVGPWLTFAYREALFALESMEIELMGKEHPERSKFRDTLDYAMLANPVYWKKYYHGNEDQQTFKRKYSFSDRARYYLPVAEVESSRTKLLENLCKHKIPVSLLSQFMPVQFYQVCEGIINTETQQLVHSYIQMVAGIYSRACGMFPTKAQRSQS